MNNSTTTILLAGATGRVGTKIAKTILNRDAELRLLVRPKSVNNPQKKAKLNKLVQYGAEVITGDVTEPESLKPAVEEINVVMSALRGGREIMVEGQEALADVARQAGARRFIPSDFSSELFKIDPDDENVANNIILQLRREAADALDATGLPTTHIMNGTFMSSMIDFPPLTPFNFDENRFEYWGDGMQPAAYTTLADAVSHAVEAALDPNPPERLRIAGDVLTMEEMKLTYEQAIGRKLIEHCLGSIADLEKRIRRLKTKASSPVDYVFHQLRYGIASGAGNLEPLNNDCYPSVAPVTFEGFIKNLKT